MGSSLLPFGAEHLCSFTARARRGAPRQPPPENAECLAARVPRRLESACLGIGEPETEDFNRRKRERDSDKSERETPFARYARDQRLEPEEPEDRVPQSDRSANEDDLGAGARLDERVRIVSAGAACLARAPRRTAAALVLFPERLPFLRIFGFPTSTRRERLDRCSREPSPFAPSSPRELTCRTSARCQVASLPSVSDSRRRLLAAEHVAAVAVAGVAFHVPVKQLDAETELERQLPAVGPSAGGRRSLLVATVRRFQLCQRPSALVDAFRVGGRHGRALRSRRGSRRGGRSSGYERARRGDGGCDAGQRLDANEAAVERQCGQQRVRR